ncbi:hypothetical protein PORY_000602 [Pneumocystis oryctolagi]|uniref:Uncharacterized protein n=1 Tax=Pneumocystis oryctolagi TaxID=42067 RepID=A0ACB7CF31_9ASCO|nr:hypothetical protein PORY_000602 [Pneumocystis oryctolagi]
MNKKAWNLIKDGREQSLSDLEHSSLNLKELNMDAESSTLDHIIFQDTETHDLTISDFRDTSYSESENCSDMVTHELISVKKIYKYFSQCINIQQFINRFRKITKNIPNSKQINRNYTAEESLLENKSQKEQKKNEKSSKKYPIIFDFCHHRKISSYFQKQSFQNKNSNYRIIYLNNRIANAQFGYCNNYISTAKYNFATFLPKFLFEQFSKYANLFFLFTSCIQQIHNISPTNRWTTVGPLIIVLLISAFKELIEDFKRRSQNAELNQSKTYAFEKKSFVLRKWIDLCVGDIVRVESGQIFPADLVLISSSEPEGLCYIETSNLDGETNLKIKQSLPETSSFISHKKLSQLSGEIHSEHPNNNLYVYNASIIINNNVEKKELPLTADQLLLRGAFLRNTAWIYGVVVFTGHETKLMKNTTSSRIKRTAIEKVVNIQIIFLFFMLIILSLSSSIGLIIKQHLHEKDLGYLYLQKENKIKTFFLNILTFCVLYSNLVPISLFVTIELVKYAQAQLINNDLDMYYEKDDIPATCRTSSLVDELGQIEYIFTDKTGTLTCNQMEFCQLSIAGISYIDSIEKNQRLNPYQKKEIFDFKQLNKNLLSHESKDVIHNVLILLSTCHTVIPEKVDGQDDIIYQAASPDEGALVKGAAKLGYRFTTQDYAISGFRTLCLAMREISEEEYQKWSIIYDEASTSINNRAFKLDEASELIEKELFLLGATAIEDKLQDGVPETIHTLQLAGIKVWVLTGDHQETAINVGISCKLITEDMNVIIINGETKKKISDYISKKLKFIKKETSKINTGTLALIIDDIAIGQFRYLKKLLLVHGAWSYQRLSKLILYSFYKNISLHMTQFWYAFHNGFSGQVIFESWTISFYNVFFTFLPPIAIGVFDQFLNANLLSKYPHLYKLGQFKAFFNIKSFWSWIANGFYHSLILYFTSRYIFSNDLPQIDGKVGGHWVWGTTLYATVLATVLGKAALITNSWTTYTILAIPGSFIIWLIFLPIYTIVAPKIGISTEYYGINSRLYTSLVFWATILVLPTLCLLRDFAWRYYKRSYYPQTYHHIQEIQKFNTTDYKSKTELFQKTVRKVRHIQRISKLQRGYAFSQGDSGQTKLIRAYDTTRERGKYEEAEYQEQ